MKSFEARESVGYRATWTIGGNGAPLDVSGWTFAATFERQAGSPDFSLGMAASTLAADEGFFVADGAGGLLSVNILPATLQAIGDTTGDFTLEADLLGTPPDSPRMLLSALRATVTKGPTA